MVTLTLSSDHRIIDGVRAAQFMQEVVGTLSDPGKWLA
jgi:pyruvate/2-oxoglutarate dehydrogenase complex dihydrolipoamide acyltransferase (E2) component